MTSARLCVIHSFNINILSAYYMPGTVSDLDDTAVNQIEPSTVGGCRLFDVFAFLPISPTGILCDVLTTRFLVSSVYWAETGFNDHLLRIKSQ